MADRAFARTQLGRCPGSPFFLSLMLVLLTVLCLSWPAAAAPCHQTEAVPVAAPAPTGTIPSVALHWVEADHPCSTMDMGHCVRPAGACCLSVACFLPALPVSVGLPGSVAPLSFARPGHDALAALALVRPPARPPRLI